MSFTTLKYQQTGSGSISEKRQTLICLEEEELKSAGGEMRAGGLSLMPSGALRRHCLNSRAHTVN